jgi:hypothetical protein
MLRLGTGYVMCSSNDQIKTEAELNALMSSILPMSMGLLILKTDLFDLNNLGFLPSVLDKFNLDLSWI